MVDLDVRRMSVWCWRGSNLCLGFVICLALWINNASIHLCTYVTLLNRLILYLKELLTPGRKKGCCDPIIPRMICLHPHHYLRKPLQKHRHHSALQRQRRTSWQSRNDQANAKALWKQGSPHSTKLLENKFARHAIIIKKSRS